jgi:hypothetical protein
MENQERILHLPLQCGDDEEEDDHSSDGAVALLLLGKMARGGEEWCSLLHQEEEACGSPGSSRSQAHSTFPGVVEEVGVLHLPFQEALLPSSYGGVAVEEVVLLLLPTLAAERASEEVGVHWRRKGEDSAGGSRICLHLVMAAHTTLGAGEAAPYLEGSCCHPLHPRVAPDMRCCCRPAHAPRPFGAEGKCRTHRRRLTWF